MSLSFDLSANEKRVDGGDVEELSSSPTAANSDAPFVEEDKLDEPEPLPFLEEEEEAISACSHSSHSFSRAFCSCFCFSCRASISFSFSRSFSFSFFWSAFASCSARGSPGFASPRGGTTNCCRGGTTNVGVGGCFGEDGNDEYRERSGLEEVEEEGLAGMAEPPSSPPN